MSPGHPLRRQLQDRFNPGPAQDVDEFIYRAKPWLCFRSTIWYDGFMAIPPLMFFP